MNPKSATPKKSRYLTRREPHGAKTHDIEVLRKLCLLFDRFPKKHNLILLGQPELMHRLAMTCNTTNK